VTCLQQEDKVGLSDDPKRIAAGNACKFKQSSNTYVTMIGFNCVRKGVQTTRCPLLRFHTGGTIQNHPFSLNPHSSQGPLTDVRLELCVADYSTAPGSHLCTDDKGTIKPAVSGALRTLFSRVSSVLYIPPQVTQLMVLPRTR
jgi:hypothetical protein